MAVLVRGGKKRYSGGGSGGSSTAYNPDLNHSLPISGFSTPIITGHLPPGAITYNANGQIQYHLPQVGGKKRSGSRRSRSRRSRSRRSGSRRSTKPFWGETLAKMAHPRSAVGGARTRKNKRSRSKKCSWF